MQFKNLCMLSITLLGYTFIMKVGLLYLMLILL